MQARDVMNSGVISVGPDTSISDIARLLVHNGISAVPVLDGAGALLGIVSEGDLTGAKLRDRERRRDWWLEMLAEGTALSPRFIESVETLRARDVMTTPVVTVDEQTPVEEIAALLERHRIKRVPVLRGGKVVGIVSRANLLRTVMDGSGTHRSQR